MEVLTFTIAGHEGRPPADAIFACPGCPQPVPARSPCPGPGPADEARPPASAGRPVIAIDGKAVRGARDKDGKAPHLVAALAHSIGAVPGQVAVDEKSNEIPAVRDLLRALAGLASAVITTGAMHTQHDTAQVILGRAAGYLMTVKASMPALYKQLKKPPWAAVPAVSAVSTDHGRRARRTIKAVLAPAWTGFDGAAQVAQLRRTVTKKGKKTAGVVYLITSDRDADPATLAAWAQPRGDRKPPSPGEGRDLSGGQIAGQDGKRAPCDGLAAEPGHQPAAPGRPGRHRRR